MIGRRVAPWLVLIAAAPALAQPADDAVARWGRGVGAALGVEAPEVQRDRLIDAPLGGDAPPEVRARMARVDLGEARATRLSFREGGAALEHAGQVARRGRGRRLIEVWGREVLVLEGPALADVARTRSLREAAWRVLPHPGGEPHASLVLDGAASAGRGPFARDLRGQAADDPALAAYLADLLGPGAVALAPDDPPRAPGAELPPPADPFGDGEAPAEPLPPIDRGPAPPVVVVAIDARTQAALGPFGGAYRAHHDDLVRRLNALGVRGIAFDVYFPESAERAEETRTLAQALAASRAPVVVARYAERGPQGLAELPNAAAIAGDPRIAEASVLGGPELLLPGGLEAARRELDRARAEGREPQIATELGEFAVHEQVGQLRPLVEELLLRTGDLRPSELSLREGLVEDVPHGLAVDGEGRLVTTRIRALRPGLVDPASLDRVSYVDVLRGQGDLSRLEGALVLVGIDDGVNDVVPSPNPGGAPAVEAVSGVYLHAALMTRVLAASRGPLPEPDLEGLIDELERAR